MSELVLPGETSALLMQASNAVVAIVRDYLGRGPTKARAHLSENVLTVVLEDNFTKAERRLVENGEPEAVRGLRRRFQSVMREEMVTAIEGLTGRTVLAFLSDHDPLTDTAAEMFVLDGAPELPAAPASQRGPLALA